MRFKQAIREETILKKLSGNSMVTKRFKNKTKVDVLAFDKQGKPLDVMGPGKMPPGFELYGRGGWDPDGVIWVSGGAGGDPNGQHRNYSGGRKTKNGFYWGIDYRTDDEDLKGNNVFFIRAKDIDGDGYIQSHILEILNAINREV